MLKLVLLRHGQSTWNLENRFTGWVDVDLSDQGIQEARRAAALLKEGGYTFELAFTSILKRAIRTLWIVLDELNQMWVPIYRSWRMNERHYGSLQGLNKSETVAEYGKDQVMIWRRSYDTVPPFLDEVAYRASCNELRFGTIPPTELPRAESLKDTVTRLLPYWFDEIVPKLKANKKILICAHGNSLRALVKHLDNISDCDISELNIPTGIPLVYELDSDLKALDHYYLGDPEEVKRAAESVARQAGDKS